MISHASYTVDVRSLDEFSARELYALLKLRVDVFVVEQACPYEELDGKDDGALHLRMMHASDLMAAARILPPVDGKNPRIGRVVVSPYYRGKRLGEAVIREALAICADRFRGIDVEISAQSHLQRFYGGLGFVAISEEYFEDGIPHVDMVRSSS
ncbi:GNAT family N-acetyltransferase [Rhizobium sp. FKY42]|uniref:GNAT family N-acetyltransferase n=1 Tax=Rhizobium sp. FKY42 TaxID=2562310 RepID=UPI0010C1445A|nr:GNAT family N-acetyltransferase [Rhizobium sp. FKY42]